MSNAIAPIGSLWGSDPVAPIGARATVKFGAGVAAPEATTTQADTATPRAPIGPNPSFQIDAPLGIIVMQLHDATGKVASTIPTAQQLNAYRRSAAHPGTQQAPGTAVQAATGTTTAATGTAATPSTGTDTSGAGRTAEVSADRTASPAPSAVTTPAIG